MLAGRVIHKQAPLKEKLHLKEKKRAGLRQSKFVFFVSEFIISAEWYEQVLQVLWSFSFQSLKH